MCILTATNAESVDQGKGEGAPGPSVPVQSNGGHGPDPRKSKPKSLRGSFSQLNKKGNGKTLKPSNGRLQQKAGRRNKTLGTRGYKRMAGKSEEIQYKMKIRKKGVTERKGNLLRARPSELHDTLRDLLKKRKPGRMSWTSHLVKEYYRMHQANHPANSQTLVLLSRFQGITLDQKENNRLDCSGRALKRTHRKGKKREEVKDKGC